MDALPFSCMTTMNLILFTNYHFSPEMPSPVTLGRSRWSSVSSFLYFNFLVILCLPCSLHVSSTGCRPWEVVSLLSKSMSHPVPCCSFVILSLSLQLSIPMLSFQIPKAGTGKTLKNFLTLFSWAKKTAQVRLPEILFAVWILIAKTFQNMNISDALIGFIFFSLTSPMLLGGRVCVFHKGQFNEI